MQRLPGVFFQVCAGQVDHLFRITDLDGHLAADHHRQLELADLITLGQIGVEVIFACENRLGRDLTLDRQTEANSAFDGFLVEYGQNAGQGDIDGIGLRIGRGSKINRTAGKYLRAGRQLSVRLDADYNFPLFHRVLLTRTYTLIKNSGRSWYQPESATDN